MRRPMSYGPLPLTALNTLFAKTEPPAERSTIKSGPGSKITNRTSLGSFIGIHSNRCASNKIVRTYSSADERAFDAPGEQDVGAHEPICSGNSVRV